MAKNQPYYLCMHPAQQQGRRSPFIILSRMIRILRPLVSDFFADIIQHIHSLRARGVISSHTESSGVFETSFSRKSVGTVCATPEATFFVLIRYMIANVSLNGIRRTFRNTNNINVVIFIATNIIFILCE
jgi:hypothetical protein